MATFDINPMAQWGQANPFGLIPGALGAITPTNAKFTSVGAPSTVGMPNPFADISGLFGTSFGATNNAAKAFVDTQLSGRVSPEVEAILQRDAAAKASRSGMPGSNAISGSLGSNAAVLKNVQTSQALQQQGFNNLGQLLNYGKSQVVSPELQTQIGTTNAGFQNQVNSQNASLQNANDQFNANNANNFAQVNLGTSKYNAENSARANPETEFNKQYELWKENLNLTKGSPVAQPPVISSLAGPGGGTGIFRDNYSFDSSGAALNPNYNNVAASGTGPAASNIWQGGYTPLMSGGFTTPQSTYTPQNLNDMVQDNDQVFAVSGTRDPFQQGFQALPQTGAPIPNWWENLLNFGGGETAWT